MDTVAPDRVTFWFGCNMLRHGEIIRLSTAILECLGIGVDPVGGSGYCCGAPKEANLGASDAMGRRTADRLAGKGNGQVVTWCPSCHIQLDDMIADAQPLDFDYAHLVTLLHRHRERLRPHLVHPVARRGVLHRHSGFERRAPVNDLVAELLAMIPGYDLAPPAIPAAPGHMCAPLAAVPAALRDVLRASLDEAEGADDLVTIFHSCHRELVAMERHREVRVVNYIHLLAEAMGLPYADSYKAWRNAEDPAALIGAGRIAAAGEGAFERAVLPELTKEPITP